MAIRDLIDEVRESVIADADMIPSRSVIYTRKIDNVDVVLNSYVGLGKFNEEELNNISNMQSFGGLKLDFAPKVGDAVEYDGEVFFVQRFQKMGKLYVVYCEISRHRGSK